MKVPFFKRSKEDELKDKLIEKAMELEPGSEEMTEIIDEVDKLNKNKKVIPWEAWATLAVTLVGTIVIPLVRDKNDHKFRTEWTREIINAEKNEDVILASTPGRQVGQNLFKF